MFLFNSETSEAIELFRGADSSSKDRHCLRYFSDSRKLDSSLVKVSIVLDSVLGNLIYLFSSKNYSKQDIGSLIQIADNDFGLKDADPRNWTSTDKDSKKIDLRTLPSKI